MNNDERVRKALGGKAVDRPPVSLWRHFPEEDSTAEGLALAHLEFQRKFDFDLLKVTPASGYYGDDWGLLSVYSGNREGTREYLERPIKKPGDWLNLARIDPTTGSHGIVIEAHRLIAQEMNRWAREEKVPVLATLFSPLSIARTLAGQDLLLRHLREEPEMLRRGLETIADVTGELLKAVLTAGADGIFFATQMASMDLLSEEEYEKFGKPYDLRLLERGRGRIIVLHLHGKNPMFDLAATYPVHGINWHDRRSGPALSEARSRYSGCLVGGIGGWETFDTGSKEEAIEEVRDAVSQTGGRGHLLAAGCVIPVDIAEEKILAVRKAVEVL